MDGDRFDKLSRSIAERSTRRQALLRFGGGGFAASLLGLAGVRAATAQDGETKTCRLNFTGHFAVGPDKGKDLNGDLTLKIEIDDGAIDDGSFKTKDGDTYDVVGQATGRALNLLFTGDNDQSIALSGVGQREILDCRGNLQGTFGGPDIEDLGTWKATRKTTPKATPTPAIGGPVSTQPGNGNNGGGPTETPVPGVTPTPCPPIDCGVTFVLNPETCECGCPPPYDRCGPVCCFGGADCTDPNAGTCSCPAGTEPCQEVCTTSCTGGQVLDSNSCQCITPTVTPIATTPPCPSGQDLCNGVCTSITTSQNCGSCGNVCPTGIPCIGISCQCPPGYTACTGGCKDTSLDHDNCGGCGVVCGTNETCVNGSCHL
jgi:CXCXC repeat